MIYYLLFIDLQHFISICIFLRTSQLTIVLILFVDFDIEMVVSHASIQMLIFALMLLQSNSLSNGHLCQCQCCQYVGPLYSNHLGICPCLLHNITTPFPCFKSRRNLTARLCTFKYQLVYDADRPNLCCRLKSF